MAKVVTNWSRPKISATLMLPTTWMLMKSPAQLDMTTYSRYQTRNAMVHGIAKPR